MTRPRLICAGLMKTGLSSARYAVKALGWSALGYMRGPAELVDQYVRFASNYDAVFDLPASAMWRELVDAYPEAKVIYTPRGQDAWLESFEDWIKHQPFETPAEREFAFRVFGRMKFRADLRIAHSFQQREVREWGEANPSRFLEFDVIGGDGWEKLCSFLGVPIPDKPFPRIRPGAPRATWEMAGVKPVGKEGETWRK